MSHYSKPRGSGEVLAARRRRRSRVVLWAFLAAYAGIVGRLLQLQLDPDLKFTKEDLRHISWINIDVPRGEILDRNERLLATDRRVVSLWGDPRHISDPYLLALQLSARLGMNEDEVLARLAKRTERGEPLKFVWIKRRLSEDEVQLLGDVLAQYPRGLLLREEPGRFYPEGQLAAHVLGFASLDGIGSEGLELTYDRYLRSIPGRRVSRVDAKRNFLASLTLEYEPPTGGDNLYLTLDSVMQHSLERELDAVLAKVQAVRAMGILLDPQTGAVMALACRPAFDPNEYWKYPPEERKNRALVEVFEPGSSFKIVTASGALEHDLLVPETMINCEGVGFNPYGHLIRNYHPLGTEPFETCFAESSNVAIVKVAAMLGKERLELWITKFGFGSTTGIDLPGEDRGIFRPLKDWSGYSMGSLPMGQEIAVTMPQLARAFSVIANGGYLIEPYLVEKAVSRDGMVTYQHEFDAPQRILSPETAATMKELCHLVVTHGTGRYANITEYRVGGKTGTAQMARIGGGGYDPGRYTVIFAGFAPLDRPRICAVIVVQEPHCDRPTGGVVCGPVFKRIVREALIQMNCPEDPVSKDLPAGPMDTGDADLVMARTVGALAESTPEELLQPLDGLDLTSYSADAPFDEPCLPDFTGRTKRQAQREVTTLGLTWDPQGAGRVIYQYPPPGTPLDEIVVCRLWFAPAPDGPDHETLRAAFSIGM
ncbi:MAG: transpeptidase family protein [Candidatus Hydrogenedentes bacterium]|nr:transpeptidase family protein [Candidatus Hydrogenedentota bacterium]